MSQRMHLLVLATAAHEAHALDTMLECIQQTATVPITILSDAVNCSHAFSGDNVVAIRRSVSLDTFGALFPSQDDQQQQEQANNSGPSNAVLAAEATMTQNAREVHQLHRKITKRDKRIKSLTVEIDALHRELEQANEKIQHFQLEQDQFFHDVTELKVQYDKLLDNHQKLLWEYLPATDPDMSAIPCIEKSMPESSQQVGQYPFQDVLGYGQYAVVYATTAPHSDEPLAIKAIEKQKLVDVIALQRVSSEIASLQDPNLQHRGILGLRQVIHTPKHMYLVTERGGKDMFEYFGAHQHGIAEDTIKPIVLQIAEAIQVLHTHNYCHRDLKPENILIGVEEDGRFQVKVVDFGLCTKASASPEDDPVLYDFCGSPGFFAPEILLQDQYNGLKADVWSLGCIILELVLGNNVFASLWMSMYDLETLKDRRKFAEHVKRGLTLTREYCMIPKWAYSNKLRQLLLSMLSDNPDERLSIHQVVGHAWFAPPGANSPVHTRSHTPILQPVIHHAPHTENHHPDVQDTATSGGSSPSPRSPNKAKSVPTALSELPGAMKLNITIRPLSAEPSPVPNGAGSPISSSQLSPLQLHTPAPSPASSPPKTSSTSAPSPTKLSLPSLSPEKPPGSRSSPERAFAKQRSTGQQIGSSGSERPH